MTARTAALLLAAALASAGCSGEPSEDQRAEIVLEEKLATLHFSFEQTWEDTSPDGQEYICRGWIDFPSTRIGWIKDNFMPMYLEDPAVEGLLDAVVAEEARKFYNWKCEA